ncbi:putative Xre family transcriptional regulator [Selenomonas ruminantium subsp. lactilytica TAM6421]|uniref:Putative Xre family transcriptional regulator n=1 Tax=Selenomonas ruminantium subsp. lactilytica (strain NBRC 103574 / TAM6421) TaxID=927704 RepID=I0GPA3_SELRL|nr:helix-turn-helix domain-containing protein [Selenomonas ruminantium]BAL82590.1 putative Xre family transcriptional regulator [Selenomonas ruminantium subsp. lactilytica TAM6421]
MIGDMLRSERERQNLTIQDIAKGTSIRALYIEAIENGEYDKLPGKVYAKGFIRNYANFLKMDADAIVHRFMEENHPEDVAAAEEAKQQLAEAEVQNKEEVKQKLAMGSEYQEKVSSPSNRSNNLLIALIVLLVAGGAYYLFAMDDSNAPKQPTKAVTQTAKAPASAEKKAEEPKEAQPVKTDGVELVAKFTDKCWTQVVADGKTVYEGTMESGKTETWKGKDKVVITAGNAGAVEMKVNGKDMGKAGNVGQVVEKTFTADGQAADAAAADKKDSK